MIKHSVEKIGGTSMSRYDDVLKNIWQRPQVPMAVLKHFVSARLRCIGLCRYDQWTS